MKTRIAEAKDGNKAIRLMRGEQVEVGIDVHKRTFSVTLWSEQRQSVVSCWTQPADAASLIRSLAPCKQSVGRVVYEAGPTGYGLVRVSRPRWKWTS